MEGKLSGWISACSEVLLTVVDPWPLACIERELGVRVRVADVARELRLGDFPDVTMVKRKSRAAKALATFAMAEEALATPWPNEPMIRWESLLFATEGRVVGINA
jgi:hypothetical protein